VQGRDRNAIGLATYLKADNVQLTVHGCSWRLRT
jgi:hypothetical protein